MATTYQISSTGSNRKTVPAHSSGDLVCQVIPASTTISTDTDGFDGAGDFQVLFDVPDGAKLKTLFFQSAAQDAGAQADHDIVLRITDGTTTTDTVLLNAGSAFQSAYDDRIPLYDQYVDATGATDKVGQVGLKVVTPAQTNVASIAISGESFYQ